MLSKVATLAAIVAGAHTQSACTLTPETHPSMTWSKCAEGGTCTSQEGSVVIDSNWRWLHTTDGYVNCYTGNEWDAALCPSNAECATSCCLDGAEYEATYGASTSGNALTLKFVTEGEFSTNIGSRLYLLESESKYQGFTLLGNEFTFDVDVSNLDCGLNGALYFSSMDLDGGVSKFPSNTAGPKYGTGYCDSQCARDVKFIDGEANVEGWAASSNDANAGIGNLGACCAEMDIWEANKIASAYTPHPCTNDAYHSCVGDACGGTYAADRYGGDCDPDGCDFNSYRQGDLTFYGPDASFAIDSTKPMTVVTQFLTGSDGTLSDIKRFYVQDGKALANSESLIAGVSGNSVTEDYCVAQKAAFGDNTSFMDKGGLATMSTALSKPMVLVMSLWDDHAANMLWLDSTYPTDSTKLGAARGSCATTSGVPADVEAEQPGGSVIYSNIKFGPIGSTFDSTGVEDPGSTPTTTGGGTPTATSTSTSEAYGFAYGTTGGGSAAPAAPKDISELKSWLADRTPRVILIDKTFDFIGTEGTATDSGCEQCAVSSGGQDYLGTLSCSGDGKTAISSISYDAAGTTPLEVASDKTILGVGSSGVISGKGLTLPDTTKNVIIRNIHITNINPQHVWGGDALTLQGNDGVWIDHNKFSLIGRQFIVSHYGASRFTVSNNEFDGVTTTSATCNGNHYWTNMFIGPGDLITIDGNYYHDVSGRAPKLGADGVTLTVQASNNLFSNMKGHAFDIYDSTSALLEGNVFESVDSPMASYTGPIYNVPDSSSASACSSTLGRACEVNTVTGSGDWPSLTNTAALTALNAYTSKMYVVTPLPASSVKSKVTGNAGVGHI